MAKISKEEYNQLITRLEEMCRDIQRPTNDNEVMIRLNDFWYMEKIAELQFANAQFEESLARASQLRKLMDEVYRETSKKYRNDLRWLRKHLRARELNEYKLKMATRHL